MSHVDEGTLHAYLDGELPSAERAAVDAHLAQCGTCRAALAEERALLERATALLGAARPRERAAPPFEQLRREPPVTRSPWHARTSLAWAASIALAVGIGYYLHTPQPVAEHFVTRGDIPTTVAQVEREPDVQRQDRPAARPAPHRVRGTRDDTRALAPQVSATVDSIHRVDSTVAGVVAREDGALRSVTPTPASTGSAAAAPAPRMEESNLQTRGLSAEVTQRQRRGAVPRDLVATSWTVITHGTAASLLGENPVGLPGLATIEIRRSPGPDTTVVVEQSLDAGTVIRIYQRPMAPSFLSFDSASGKALTDRLARYVGRLRVEISGPLSADSLNRLLEQVEPIR